MIYISVKVFPRYPVRAHLSLHSKRSSLLPGKRALQRMSDQAAGSTSGLLALSSHALRSSARNSKKKERKGNGRLGTSNVRPRSNCTAKMMSSFLDRWVLGGSNQSVSYAASALVPRQRRGQGRVGGPPTTSPAFLHAGTRDVFRRLERCSSFCGAGALRTPDF